MRMYHSRGYVNILPISTLLKTPNNYYQLQINTGFHYHAIMMDIDDESLATEWNSVGLPVPSIQTYNKNNNKCHLVWLLRVPISKNNKRAVSYYKSIVKSITSLIGADPAYQNHQTKNFLNNREFRAYYNDASYELDDFSDFIIDDIKKVNAYEKSMASEKFQSSGSRHIDLFEQLRMYAYSIAKRKNFLELIESRAEELNKQFDAPIKTKYIIKSIYDFCMARKNNFRQQSQSDKPMNFKKISGLSSEEFKIETLKRKRAAANRTAAIKRNRTAIKIKVAIDYLVRHKEKATYRNIAAVSKMSLRTVKNYVSMIKLFKGNNSGAISSIKSIVQRVKRICTISTKQAYTCYIPICKRDTC